MNKVNSVIKLMIFQTFFNFRHFFRLCYYPLLTLCIGGAALAALLHITADKTVTGYDGVILFVIAALSISILKHYYSAILAWSDTRDKTDTVTPLR